MAIAFDAATDGGITNPGTSHTFSHTVGSGSNRILFAGAVAGAGDVVTGVTYNGTAMTQINKRQVSSGRWAYLFYLLAPSTGANNVVISASSSGFLLGHAVSYDGAAQSGQPDASSTEVTSTSNSVSTSVTTVADNCWTVCLWSEDVGRTMTGDGNTTMRAEIGDGHGMHMGDSNAAKTPAGSVTLGGTVSNSTPNWAELIASFAPAAAASTFTPVTRSSLLGVGI